MQKVDGDSEPQPGDVDSVTFADPPNANTRTGPLGRIPEDDERVAIRLVGHPFKYVVRVTTDMRTGPRLIELTVTAEDGRDIDAAAMRAVPVRRLAASATQWLSRHGGQVGFVGDVTETFRQPENPAPKVWEAAKHANQALALGRPVRPYVAERLIVSKTTVDRLLKRAKAEGWVEDQPLPKGNK